MDIRKVSDDLIYVGSDMVIERGPVRRQAVATEELLDDKVTASHYYAGTRKARHGAGTIDKVGRDSLGRPIVLGQPMDYIDWKSPERCFYVKKLLKIAKGDVDPITGKKAVVPIDRYMPAGDHAYPTYEAALGATVELAAKGA